MSNRSWFFASQGQQQGPFPEAQLRAFIASGTVTAETLVWTEGMTGWQKAGEIPGLLSAAAGPPGVPYQGSPPASTGSLGSGSLSLEFGIWEFIWRSVVFLVGAVFIIPLPWVLVMYCRWIVSRTHVPARPNLTFTGRPLTILWWYLGAIVLIICLSLTGIQILNALTILIQLGLYWLAIKWFVANIASNGQPLGLSFSGSFWGYLGWNVLAALSIITIIGWAWVYTAQMRWVCRHLEGTRRQVVFKASGLQYLWRAIVAVLACSFIIPIPWALRWIMRWHASQTVLVEKTAYAGA
jgi:heme/copper-type cytochrome/quinol oxidase subunit 2